MPTALGHMIIQLSLHYQKAVWIYVLPWWLRRLSVCLQCGRPRFDPWVGKIPWRRKWQSTPVLLPGKSHGKRSLVGYSPWGRKELDTTEWLYLKKVLYLFVILINFLSFWADGNGTVTQSPDPHWHNNQTVSIFLPILLAWFTYMSLLESSYI